MYHYPRQTFDLYPTLYPLNPSSHIHRTSTFITTVFILYQYQTPAAQRSLDVSMYESLLFNPLFPLSLSPSFVPFYVVSRLFLSILCPPTSKYLVSVVISLLDVFRYEEIRNDIEFLLHSSSFYAHHKDHSPVYL